MTILDSGLLFEAPCVWAI